MNLTLTTTFADSAFNAVKGLDRTRELVEAVLRGDKPTLDPENRKNGWIFEQVARMHAGDFVSENPEQYFLTPGREIGDRMSQGITTIHPFPDVLNAHADRVRAVSAGAGVKNLYVCGTDIDARAVIPVRENGHVVARMDTTRPLAPKVPNWVLVPGDLQAMDEFMIRMRRNADLPQRDRKLLVLQNENGFWDPMIRGLGIKNAQKAEQIYGLRITRSPEETSAVIKAHGTNPEAEPNLPASSFRYDDGATILVGTTNPKKMKEARKIIQAQGVKVHARPAEDVLTYFLAPDETSVTYAGNALEKVTSILSRIYDELGPAEVRQRMRNMSIDPDKAIFIANDTGLRIFPVDEKGQRIPFDFLKTEEFADSAHEATPGKDWPGVETSPVMDAEGGISQFYRQVFDLGRKRGFDLACKDDSVYLAFKLADRREDVRVYGFKGTVNDDLRPNPSVSGKRVVISEDFQIPRIENEESRTRRELGEKVLVENSSNQGAMATLLSVAGIPKDEKLLQFANAAKLTGKAAPEEHKRLRVATQYAYYDEKGHGQPGFPRMVRSHGLTMAAGTYAHRDEGETSVGREHFNLNRPESLQSFMRGAEAIAFTPLPEGAQLEKNPPEFLRHLLMFSSVGVARQIRDESMYEKPFVVVNGEDGAWKPLLSLYEKYFDFGLIKQEPHLIFSEVKDAQTALRSIVTQLEEYERYEAPYFRREETGVDFEGYYTTAVLGSASTRQTALLEEVDKFCDAMLKEGDTTFNHGGGANGVMGQVGRSVLARRGKDGYAEGFNRGVQMPRTLQLESRGEGFDHFVVERDIFARMYHIFKADSLTAFAGGLGTQQEIALAMVMKFAGHPLVKDKPLILVNSTMKTGEGLYDWMQTLMDQPDNADPQRRPYAQTMNVHIVPDGDSAAEIVNAHRRTRQWEQRLQSDRTATAPVSAPVKAFG